MSQQINLVNPLLLRKRYAFGLREMAVGVAVSLVLALVWAGYGYYRADALDTQATQLESIQAAAQQEVDALNTAASRPASALLTERLETLRAQVAQRESLLATLDGTLNATSSGFAAHMRALAMGRVDGVWLNRLTLSPGYVALEGSTLDAALLPAFMDALGRQAPFAGMSLSGMTAAPTEGTEQGAGTTVQRPVNFALYSGKRAEAVGGAQRNGQ